ncbi:uncharacterized protein LOC122057165 [Macadamia integrifolia]|uniref:uncharacterized protein LOC122057165 n=1 Tax=Macadamia integrifolia TaxID=60698 RepID=UPI001C5341E2|nr:uncharacterized protein LOC122057165 [Macadamia integrifolia]
MEEEEAITELFLTIMGDYRDSVIPPLSYFSPLPQTITTSTATARGGSRDRKAQLPKDQSYTKVAELFKDLQTIVPTLQLKPTSTQERVVSETIHYIAELEQKLMKLEAKRKASVAAMVEQSCTHQNFSVEVRVSGDIAFFVIESVMQKGFAVKTLMVLEKHQAEVLAANINANEHKITLTITALVKKRDGDEVQRIRTDLLLLLS